MDFVLLRSLPSAFERRYDGPVPLPRHPPAGSALLERLAAEAAAQAALRRGRVVAVQVLADRTLGRHVGALADYRRQAVALRR